MSAPFAELEALYRDVDARHAAHSCPASTECCRFGVTGREPYVTSVELAYLTRAIARRGGRTPPPPPPLVRSGLPMLRDERVCPLLDPSGKCSAYDARPLGCRSFYCDRASWDARVTQREIGAWVRRVKEIALAHEPRGDEGRPLTNALPAARGAATKRRARPRGP